MNIHSYDDDSDNRYHTSINTYNQLHSYIHYFYIHTYIHEHTGKHRTLFYKGTCHLCYHLYMYTTTTTTITTLLLLAYIY